MPRIVTAILAVLIVAGHPTRISSPIAERQSQSNSIPTSSPANLIDELDRNLQKRFHNVIGFGMARIATEKKFVPETAEEKAAVAAIKNAKLKLALFLAGRLVLDTKPDRLKFQQTSFFSRALSNALFVSGNRRSELPDPFDLWSQAREGFSAFSQNKDSIDLAFNSWNVRVRPVRASDQECLRCHVADYRVVYSADGSSRTEPTGSKIDLGSPIGALLYLYSLER